MSRLRVKIPSAVLLLLSCALAQSVTVQQSNSRQPVQRNLPTTPSVEPVAPLLPEQMPPSPPLVTCSDDTLTINANNATLGDILAAVQNQTGAMINVPANATGRVFGRFGPGPVRDVLGVLLNGFHFNYVLLGSTANPNGLERIVLMSQAGSMDEVSPASLAPQAKPSAVVPQAAAVDDGAELPDPPEEATDDQTASQPPVEQQQPPQLNPSGEGGVVKTPQQLLQEMQQRQQQMQPQQPEQD